MHYISNKNRYLPFAEIVICIYLECPSTSHDAMEPSHPQNTQEPSIRILTIARLSIPKRSFRKRHDQWWCEFWCACQKSGAATSTSGSCSPGTTSSGTPRQALSPLEAWRVHSKMTTRKMCPGYSAVTKAFRATTLRKRTACLLLAVVFIQNLQWNSK